MRWVAPTSIALIGLIVVGVFFAVRGEESDDAQIEVTTRGNLTLLSMPREDLTAGMGAGGKLVALPSGCVALRARGSEEDLVVIWPAETRIEASGTITSSLGRFRVGQEVRGGAQFWSSKRLKPSRAVTSVCPSDEYVQVIELQHGPDGPGRNRN